MPAARMVFIIDPPERLDPPTDTSLALMQEALRRGHDVRYGLIEGLFVEGGLPTARVWEASFASGPDRLSPGGEALLDLSRSDAVFMRKDPPADLAYLHAAGILDLLPERVLQVNPGSALCRHGEKVIPLRFAGMMPETIVACRPERLEQMFERHDRIVVKPLEECSGRGILVLERDDPRRIQRLEEATAGGKRFVQGQEFLPGIVRGDIRVLLLGGRILGWVRRVPAEGSFLSNVNAGGRCEPCSLGETERALCARLAPWLRKEKIHLAGVDIVDGKLLEVNITSPSCLREIDDLYGLSLEAKVLDYVEDRIRGCPSGRPGRAPAAWRGCPCSE